MSTPTVHLHIGAMKSGTTFVQRQMSEGKERLAEAGVLFPTPWTQQSAAVRDVLALERGAQGDAVEGAWDRLRAQISAWPGSSAVVSMEFLSFADRPAVERIVSDLAPSPVRVVLSVRDLGRVLPAQWQTAVRNRRTQTYGEYVERVCGRRPSRAKLGFWKRQDFGRIAGRWADVVGTSHVVVVTVPPRGSDPTLLWRRMAQALDLTEVPLDPVQVSNESLGTTACELLRRLNQGYGDLPAWVYQNAVNQDLSHHVLPGLPDRYPPLGLPEQARRWAQDETERVVAELEASGVRIIGDLADLQPQQPVPAGTVLPEQVPESDLLAMAVAALGSYAEFTGRRRQAAERRRRQPPAAPGD